MTLTIKDVEHVAKLSRLNLSQEEQEKFTNQLATILEYIEKLKELDTEDIEPMMHALATGNVLREDLNIPSLDHDKILKNAPEKENGFFKVKKVIE
ncbi:Asp-tRNA(Asn)/Glu-tRNA(Gln) amidotransferase subunit GatC [bacterium]